MIDLKALGQRSKAAASVMAVASNAQKVAALQALADGLKTYEAEILAANKLDVDAAKAAETAEALVERLTLFPKRLEGIANDVRNVADLPDPVGTTFDERELPNGLQICRQRVPLGTLGVIYESRPNVTIDIAALAIKTGNTAILRGGSDNLRSNQALMKVVHGALESAGLPADTVLLIENTDRKYVGGMLNLHDYIDIIIPRGGHRLHAFCRENSTIPVITGGIGICHYYIDETADLDASIPVIINGKTQRPSVCNTLDTLIVNEKVAAEFLPKVVSALGDLGVEFKAGPRAIAYVDVDKVSAAGPDDFDTEWMALVLGLMVVDTLDEAIVHINAHSMGHSDAIMSATPENIEKFVNTIDSSAVMVNASTRFNDGGQLGLGAEVAVSTQRLHARGPMGLPELTTYKWVVRGDYTSRA